MPAWRRRAIERHRRWRRRHPRASLHAGALVLAWATAGGLVSGHRFMSTWENNPAPAYFANLGHDLREARRAGRPVYVLDQALPDTVMMATFGGQRMLSHVGRVFGDAAPVVGTWSPSLSVVKPDGHVVRGTVRGPSAVPRRGLTCSLASDPRRGVRVTLPNPPPAWVWKIEISYSASRATHAVVRYGSAPPVPVRLEPGLGRLYVATSGGGPDVTVANLDPGAVVCLGKVVVGNPAPAA
jgi:hypothetical protein